MTAATGVRAGLVAAVITLGGGSVFVWQQWELAALRVELAVLRDEVQELELLRKKNAQLRAAAPTEVEVARRREERAAVAALRAELEQLAELARAARR